MNTPLLEAVTAYVEQNIAVFHDKRLNTVKTKKLDAVLKQKNPHLFKAKYTEDAPELVRGIMDAFISSQEETFFGEFLEGVAIFVAEQVYGGYKPAIHTLTGIDLVFERDGQVYIVEIKSGPNWGNSSQITKMVINFKDSIRRLQPDYPNNQIIPVNGCTYGKDSSPEKIGAIKQDGKIVDEIPYLKLCGQDFWYFISNEERLYLDIIEPLSYRAKERNEAYQLQYQRLINKFVKEFYDKYCNDNGEILWESLTQFVSESSRLS